MASKLKHVSEDHAAWYKESLEHPELFWGDLARTRLRWSKDFDRVKDCDLKQGKLQWFLGGQINVSGEGTFRAVRCARDGVCGMGVCARSAVPTDSELLRQMALLLTVCMCVCFFYCCSELPRPPC